MLGYSCFNTSWNLHIISEQCSILHLLDIEWIKMYEKEVTRRKKTNLNAFYSIPIQYYLQAAVKREFK